MKIESSNDAVAVLPTPILNTPRFKEVFRYPLPLDSKGLLRPVEMIALPGTVFRILADCGDGISQITTAAYSGTHLYIDRRFVDPVVTLLRERVCELPPCKKILDHLASCEHLPYVWGGNWSRGIEQMLEFYPSGCKLDPFSHAMWTLKGVDCSGLLYEATCGYTPRNTAQLLRFGRPVAIFGKESRHLIADLRPLDLIVWSGHVMIVEDEKYVLESRHPEGVIRTPLQIRLGEILQERAPVDDWDATIGPRFVVRRWHPRTIKIYFKNPLAP